MRYIIIVILLVFPAAARSQNLLDIGDAEIAGLKELIDLTTATTHTVPPETYEKYLVAEQEIASSYAALRLFNLDPGKYESLVKKHFAVNDYRQRTNANINWIKADSLEYIVYKLSAEIKNYGIEHIDPLIFFKFFQDRNLWIEKKNLNAARIFRTIAFQIHCDIPKAKVLSVLNRIDSETYDKYLKTKQNSGEDK